jgi:hypothetical protein
VAHRIGDRPFPPLNVGYYGCQNPSRLRTVSKKTKAPSFTLQEAVHPLSNVIAMLAAELDGSLHIVDGVRFVTCCFPSPAMPLDQVSWQQHKFT